MNNVCINEEIEKFIIKYKKFMTKDIYITNKMYYTFLKKYKHRIFKTLRLNLWCIGRIKYI